MKLYKAKVLLAGQHGNQVWVEDVTAAELKVLEAIHVGENPSVIDVEETGSVNRSDRKERARLMTKYADYKMGQGAQLIKDLFGIEGVPLPSVYEPPIPVEVSAAEDDEPDEEPEVIVRAEPAPARTVRRRIPEKDPATALAG